MKWPTVQPIPLSKQALAIRQFAKGGDCEITHGDGGERLVWRGTMRPSPFSREYNILLEYKARGVPHVFLYGQNLIGLDDKDFPHHYKIDREKHRVELCLYYQNEFNGQKLLAKTIFPWTLEWLWHYEIWLAIGEWHGGGIHMTTP